MKWFLSGEFTSASDFSSCWTDLSLSLALPPSLSPSLSLCLSLFGWCTDGTFTHPVTSIRTSTNGSTMAHNAVWIRNFCVNVCMCVRVVVCARAPVSASQESALQYQFKPIADIFHGLEVCVEPWRCSLGFVYGSWLVYYEAPHQPWRDVGPRCFISCQGLLQLN